MSDSLWSDEKLNPTDDRRLAWAPARLNDFLSKYGYTNNNDRTKAYAAWVKPQDFLAATTPPAEKARVMAEAKPLNLIRLIAETQEMFLQGEIDTSTGSFRLDGHEGRHRMVALAKAGVEQVAVTFYLKHGQDAKPLEGLYVSPQTWSHASAERGFFVGQLIPISWAHRDALAKEFFTQPALAAGPWNNTADAANDQTVARNFANFFGDSHVVDAKGMPLVLHHCGTFNEAEGDELVIGEQGMHFGTLEAARQRDSGKRIDDFMQDLVVEEGINDEGKKAWYWHSDGMDSSDIDMGGFTTEAKARAGAEGFAVNQDFSGVEPMPITQAYLALINPKRMKDQKDDWSKAIEEAKSQGFDGIVYRNEFEDKGSDSYIVFYPSQVKSVHNKGLFLSHTHSITDGDSHLSLVAAKQAKEVVEQAMGNIKAGISP
jgi:hypothetical protein